MKQFWHSLKPEQAESLKWIVDIVPDDGTIETNIEFSIISPDGRGVIWRAWRQPCIIKNLFTNMFAINTTKNSDTNKQFKNVISNYMK